MTARRSSSTKRRDTGIPGRGASVVLAAALGPVLLLTGCASQPTDTRPMTLPGNQDTAAAFAVHPPVARANAAAPAPIPLTRPFITPSTTYPAPGTYTDDATAYNTMAADLMTKIPPITVSPTVNPVDPTPRLEIVGMPMWLWVNEVRESTRVPYPVVDDIVTVRTVVDKVEWYSDADGAWLTCSATPSAVGQGPGTAYVLGMDPGGAGVPDACITTAPTSPQYATSTNAVGQPTTVAAVHYIVARVTWHAQFNVTPADLPPPAAGLAHGGAVPDVRAMAIGVWADVPGVPPKTVTTGQAPVAFRVGEIQALVTGP